MNDDRLQAEWEESRELLAEARAEVERLRGISNDVLWLTRLAVGSSWPGEMAQYVEQAATRIRAVLAEPEEQAIARAALARIGSVSRETLDPIPTQVLDSPDDEPANRTRTVDHGTSAAGARAISFRAGTQKHRLLIAYAETSGLTDEEAAAAARLPSSACWWKRCSELRDVGAIEPTGETRDGAAGVPRIVCSITEQGWHLLRDSDPVVVS